MQGQKLVVLAYLKIGTPSCWQVFVRFEETLTPSGILNLVKLEINLKKIPSNKYVPYNQPILTMS